MFGKNQTGQENRRGAGFGFRGSSPPYPYTGRGRGGLPRCSYPGNRTNPSSDTPITSYEQEISWLKTRAETVRKELETIESRLHNLETK